MLYRSGRKLICFLLLFVALGSQSYGQGGLFSKQKLVNQYATVGIGGGTSHYFGDLAPYTYFYYGLYTNVRWNGSINYTRFLTTNTAARVSFSYARIFGDDASYSNRNFDKMFNNYLRNLHFRNDIKEFTLQGLFNIVPQYGKGSRGRNSVVPYVAVGLGFLAHNPMARSEPKVNDQGVLVKGGWEPLKSYSTAGQGLAPAYKSSYSLIQLVVPLGAGVRVKLNEKFDFTAEIGLRISPSDYLDDVGNDMYVSNDVLNANIPYAAQFAYRANQDNNALTLESRVPQFLQIVQKLNGTVNPNTSPSNYAETIYGYNVGSSRGSKWPDAYVMTQFTISYILSNAIKCPPIK